MVDTNIVVSAALFPKSTIARVLLHIASRQRLLICAYTFEELEDVFARKFPNRITALRAFLRDLSYTRVEGHDHEVENVPLLRDCDDQPILVAALASRAAVLVSGDKDFAGVEAGALKIVTPAEYARLFM